MKTKIAFLIGALVGVIILFIALNGVLRSYNIKKLGHAAESTVVQILSGSLKSGWSKVSVEFITKDGTSITGIAQTRHRLSPGSTVKIWYDPAAPSRIDFGDTISYNMRGVWLGGLFLIFGLYFFIRISIKDRLNQKLIRTGTKVEAESISVERNEKYMQGDRNPWRIRCSWKDLSNREYYFVSKDYTIDPTPYLAGRTRIEIYFDAANPSNYYMDTSFMPKGNYTIG
ncbi:MAG: DUF3592 domain-containing protein [Prolixibacteraceae bacterium]|nr:DUF3592 domain-containing protein [Prolixibacteraceae bacterium]